jgi:predicted permease
VKREIDEELRFHLEQRTAENIADGMSPDDAARAARKQFGNFQSVREECRQFRGGTFGESFFQDVRFGLRGLKKNPGFTAVAILTLALGIGANTAMFSLVNLLFFHPLPYPESGRLARIFRISSRSSHDGHSIGVFLDVREQNTVFEHVAAYYPQWPCNLAEPGQPAELLSGMLATADFFSTLGIQPELGRGFTAEEDRPGNDGVVVLSHRFWQERFGGDRNIIGRALRLDGQNAVVVGVMPEHFHNALLWGKVDLLRPFAFAPDQRQNRGDRWRFAFGRLKPGVSMAQADAEMKALAGRFAKEYPKTEEGYGLRALSLRDSLSEGNGPIMWLTLGLAGFVLLIACANLANLFLARLAGRSRELAVRAALGAGRMRLLRQLLTESLLISLIGGGFGLLLAVWAKNFVGNHLPISGESRLPIPLDVRVLGFALLCCVTAAVLFGTTPAWLAARKDVNRDLKENSRGNSGSARQRRWRHALIVGEVALAVVLLSGAGIFIRGLQQFAGRDPGWRVDGLLTAQLDLTSDKYKTPDQRRAFFKQLAERAAAIPGVQSATFSSRPPVLGSRNFLSIAFEGRPPAAPGQNFFAGMEPVSPNYFETIGIRLKEGRLFTAADAVGKPDVVIINETMARRCWPSESPIGKRIADRDSPQPAWREIVGVVSDVRTVGGIDDNVSQPQTYRPLAQDPPTFAYIELRVAGATKSAADGLRRAVASVDPDQSIYKIVTAREFLRRELNSYSLLGGILAAFAGLGLSLAAIGIFGVVSYTVAQRTGEIGLRMALGAQRRDVLWLVLRQGLGHSLLGSLAGLAGAFGVARVLTAVIPFPMPSDFATFGGVVLVLTAASLLACLVPARRAAKTDPLVALRCE